MEIRKNFNVNVHDLTFEQCELLDDMWSKDTVEELAEYLNGLSLEKYRECLVLLELIKLAEIDYQVEQQSFWPLAEHAIESIRR